jgi:hypothetical protein
MLVDADDEPLDTLPVEVLEETVESVTERGAADSIAMEYRFYESSRLAIGDAEYKLDPEFWATQFSRDFEIIKERLRMEQEALSTGAIVSEADLSGLETPVFHWERVGGLRLVSLQQFVLESNQGIFREDRFYCDKGRGWLKKTMLTLSEHGFPYARKVQVEGRWLIEVSRNPMGEL